MVRRGQTWDKKITVFEEKIVHWIWSSIVFIIFRLQPLTLADLCRIHIRQWFGERLRISLEASPLPARVVRFLMLEDVEVDLWHEKIFFCWI